MPSLDLSCPTCGSRMQAPDSLLGKNVQCPKCRAVFTADLQPATAELVQAAPVRRTKKCPCCGEAVLKSATKCKHCGETIDNRSDGPLQACPYCREQILNSAKKCKHCGETIDVAMREAQLAREEARRAADRPQHGPITISNTAAGGGGGAASSSAAATAMAQLWRLPLRTLLGIGALVLLLPFCCISRLACVPNKQPIPQPNPGTSPGKPSVVPAKSEPIVKTIKLDRKLEYWDPRVTLTLVKIDLRNDRRMRWEFAFWNQSGERREGVVGDAYVTDEHGNHCKRLDSSFGGWNSFQIDDGVKAGVWIDFQEPGPGAKTLTAHFRQVGNNSFPKEIEVRLP